MESNTPRALFAILVALALIGTTSCRKDRPVGGPGLGELELIVEAKWGDEPFSVAEPRVNITNYRVLFDMIRLYLAEIELVGPANERLTEIELFNLGAASQVRRYEVPAGTWSGVRMGIGVPSALNFSDPALYPQGHPLSVSNGTYWTWTTGYRFVIFDGRYDVDPEGTGTILPVFSIHPGLDTCYTVVQRNAAQPIVVRAGETTQLRVEFDVSRFFYSAVDTLDLAVDNQAHGDNIQLATRFMDLVSRAMTLQ